MYSYFLLFLLFYILIFKFYILFLSIFYSYKLKTNIYFMDFSFNLQPNQQFHAKLQNGNYTLEELRKFRKKNVLEAKLVDEKMR